MIKINLLTTKPSKKIPIGTIIPGVIILAVVATIIPAWMYFEDFAAHYNDGLKEEEQAKKQERDKNSSKVKKRDDLKKKLQKVKNEINRLQRLSGANFVQWSETLKTLKEIYPKDKVWITSFRVDSDRKVSISAYSSNEVGSKAARNLNNQADGRLTVGIQDFIKKLMQHQYFSDVFLTSATKNVYEKKPVWRFDLNCRLKREY